MQTPIDGMNGPLPYAPLQIVKLTFQDGGVIQAPVDLWMASLIDVLDEETKTKLVERIKQHIEAIKKQQVQPVGRVIIPGRG